MKLIGFLKYIFKILHIWTLPNSKKSSQMFENSIFLLNKNINEIFSCASRQRTVKPWCWILLLRSQRCHSIIFLMLLTRAGNLTNLYAFSQRSLSKVHTLIQLQGYIRINAVMIWLYMGKTCQCYKLKYISCLNSLIMVKILKTPYFLIQDNFS